MNTIEAEQNRPEERQNYYRDVIRSCTMMNDTFLRSVLKDRSCAEYVLQVILDREDLKILSAAAAQDSRSLQVRADVLDCVAQDSDGMLYNIKIRLEEEGSSPLQARYCSSAMDLNTLDTGRISDRPPETCVIFLSEHDVLREGRPIYHIKRVIQESGNRFPDLSLILYVNTSIHDDSSLGSLMHDFHCRNAEDMYSPVLARRARALKETPQELESMCRELKEIEDYGIEYGINQGRLQEKKANVRKMYEKGLSVESIADILEISTARVREWISVDAASV